MPRFEVTSPDGRRFEVNAPEGASQDDAIEYAQSQMGGGGGAPQLTKQQRAEAINANPSAADRELYDPTSSMSTSLRFAAGFGKGITDVGRGVGQMLGIGPSEAETDETRRRDAPLENTTAGMVGNIAGNVATALPAAFIPGVNTLAGSAAVGAGLGALQPVGEQDSRLENMGMGAAAGFAGQGVARGIGRALKPAAAPGLREQVARRAAEEGLVIPPSQREGAGMGSRMLEGFGGKIKTAQEASAHNAERVTVLARRALGLSEDAELTPAAFDKIRRVAAEPYREISKIHPIAKKALEDLKEARFHQNQYFRHSQMTGDPKSYQAAQRFQKTAARIEATFDRLAQTSNKPDLMQRLKAARTLIAKAHDVERATNVATGNLEPALLGKMLDKGAPLTGELKLIAEFAEAFPKAAQPIERMGSLPAISPLDIASGGILGGAGVAAGGPAGLLAAGIPLLRPLARRGLLSKPFQRSVGRRGAISRAADRNPSAAKQLSEQMKRLGLLSPAVAVSGQ